jgi:hypothetical protein
VSEANRALKQGVSKIVMDTARGSLTFHWHHADEPRPCFAEAISRRPIKPADAVEVVAAVLNQKTLVHLSPSVRSALIGTQQR